MSALAPLAKQFVNAWARPSLERFALLMHQDIVLRQPVTPPIRGRDAALHEFAKIMRWLPDLRGEVDETAQTGNTHLIAWRLGFSLAGRPYTLRIVDRIVEKEGLIGEREAYYDSLGFMLALLRRPRAWAGYLRYRGYWR